MDKVERAQRVGMEGTHDGHIMALGKDSNQITLSRDKIGFTTDKMTRPTLVSSGGARSVNDKEEMTF